MVLMAPKDEPELQQMMVTAMHHSGPAAIRYPRGVGPGHELLDSPSSLTIGAGERLKDGRDAAVLAVGGRVYPALEAVRRLEERGAGTFAVYNARFIKPLPAEIIQELAGQHSRLLILEENVLAGGFSSAVLEFLADKRLMSGLQVTRLGLPDRFVQHGSIKDQLQEVGLDIASIEKALENL
jgi:1-deoxy-D-xylulose-5-phosphate synthase